MVGLTRNLARMNDSNAPQPFALFSKTYFKAITSKTLKAKFSNKIKTRKTSWRLSKCERTQSCLTTFTKQPQRYRRHFTYNRTRLFCNLVANNASIKKMKRKNTLMGVNSSFFETFFSSYPAPPVFKGPLPATRPSRPPKPRQMQKTTKNRDKPGKSTEKQDNQEKWGKPKKNFNNRGGY